MLESSEARLLATVGEDKLVLDVGGGRRPLARADWVVDLLPFDEPEPTGGPARVTRERWVQRDVCDRAPWPFDDGQFDFAVCSHTLEDVRDPLWVCSELIRVARAGYIEVPSRLAEQSWGVAGQLAGWSHHRWLVDVEGDRIVFVLKPHFIHTEPGVQLPPGFHATLAPGERVQQLWWDGAFDYAERYFYDHDELVDYLTEPLRRSGAGAGLGWRLRTRLARAVRGG